MVDVVILGGHGKVGMRLARLLSERGDGVTSVFRRLEHEEEVRSTGANPVVLDLEQSDVHHIEEVVAGKDAVVWSAGAGGGNPSRTYAVDRDAAIRTAVAAAKADVQRFVMVSYLGSRPDHGVPHDDPFYPYAEAKATADEHLRGSGLDWTILQPGGLSDDPGTGRVKVTSQPEDTPVSRDDVAAAVVAALDEPATVHRSIGFVGGDTPIAQALRDAATDVGGR